MTRRKYEHKPLEKFIRKNTDEFKMINGVLHYKSNEKIEQKIAIYDDLLLKVSEVDTKMSSGFFCVNMPYKINEEKYSFDDYGILRYVIKAASHYIKIKTKKGEYDSTICYVKNIYSAKNASFLESGEYGYDYKISLNGKKVFATTHPSDFSFIWIYDIKDVIELLKKDNIELEKESYDRLLRRDFTFNASSEEKIPSGTVEVLC